MASRNIGTLSVDLVLKSAGFTAGLDAAGRAAKKKASTIGADFAAAGRQLAILATAAAGVLSVFTKQAISAQDELHDLSEVTGVSTEALSQLSYAAEQSGTSFDAITRGLAKLGTSAVDAARNIGAPAQAFDDLKISATNADDTLKSTEDLLLEVADAFAGMADGAAKINLARDLFGRGGEELIPFLNQGRAGVEALMKQFDAFGGTVTDASAALADEFNDNLKDLKSISQGVFNQFATQILPLLVQFSDSLVESSDDMIDAEESARKLAAGFKFLASIGVALKASFEAVGTVIGGVAAAIGRLADTQLPETGTGTLTEWVAIRVNALKAGGEISEAFADARSNAIDDIEAIDRIWNEATENIKDATNDLKQGVELEIVDEAAVEAAAKATTDALKSIQDLQAGLEQQTATFEQGETAVIAYRIANGDLADTFAAAGAAADPYRDSLVALTAEYEILRIKAEAAAKAEQESLKVAADIEAVTESMLTPLQRYEAERKRLADLLGSGLDPEVYELAIAEAEAAYKKSFDQLTIFTQRASENVQDIIADNLISGFDEGVEGMLKSFARMIQEMLAQAIAADIAKALFGGGGVGSGGGFFGFVRDLFGGGRASGGSVAAGTAYMVGERGPELFMPNVNGSIIPNGSQQPNVYITQNNHIEGSNLGPEQMVTILNENNKKLKGEFLQELRRGTYS